MKKVLVMLGTRPEAIKMIPLYKELAKRQRFFAPVLVSTGQHREMLDQVFKDFDVKPDIDLHVMTSGQTLASMSSKLFVAIDQLLEKEKPDLILVQGDTTTVQVASLCAFYRKIPVGHIEAGLRSHNMELPFPEELNRRVTGLVSKWHFSPTELSKVNLLREGVAEDNICVSGNTVIDSLLNMQKQVTELRPDMPEVVVEAIENRKKIILVTGHRRESIGSGFEEICTALKALVKEFPDVVIVYPVHLNPLVRNTVMSRLANIDNILLIDPLSYRQFVYLMDHSYLILTDSGGIQEEGPSIGKPVLIMRDVTERPEGIDAGVNFLVGTSAKKIVECVKEFLMDQRKYHSVSSIPNPYGDGYASKRIVDYLISQLY